VNLRTTTQRKIKIMKTKIYWYALLASAAMIAQANAGGHHGGGGGGSFAGHASAGAGFHSAPMHNFGGGRFGAPGQRFSSMGARSPNSFRQPYISSSGSAAIGARQFTPGNFNRSNGLTRFGNNRQDRLAQFRNRAGQHNGTVRNHSSQVRNGNNLPANWRNHVAGQRSGNWHRDWDRGRDHFWNGHRCRFVNGSWFIFDFGFPWYDYGYPYDYYADDYYPYEYEDQGADYGQGAYDSADEYAQSTVGAAQAQLSRQGYYQGKIDGVYGAATRRAVMRYQSDHGLRVTGSLSADTLQALGLPRVARN
jgi:putative peptidoglycan binding protein